MIIETLTLVSAFAVGVLLGVAFFGGLWWTVRNCVSSPHPALWLLGSQLLRTSLALVGFFAVSRGRWQNLLACLAGFILARLIVVRITRASEWPTYAKQEVGHAPESR